ncbi:MAG: tyrosine-type recombinase/integrase [Geobacteraceae bacterium]|nr:tyrosine-type recombinase/integrase [Geobacteraceae bacterium]
MSYRLHPTKNKNLQPGEPRWYQVEIGHSDNRKTIVMQFENDRQAQIYDNDQKRAHRPEISTIVAPTLNQILPDFVEWYGLHRQPRALEAWLQSWNNLSPHFGKLKPNYLTPALIDHYKSHRLAQKAGIRANLVCKRTVQKELNCLSGIIRFATERNFCEPLPFKIATFPKSQTAPRKKIIPTPDQVEAMLAETRSDLRPLYQLLYYTGMRSEEARTITADSVNLESNVILISGKGNKQRIVPIIPQLKPVLEELKKGKKAGDLLLISKRSGKGYKPNIGRVGASAEKAGITAHMSAHMFRHCFATHCIYWGLDTRTVQMLLGHSAITTTQMYTELAASFLTQEMSRFGNTPTETANKPKQKQPVKSKC